MKLVMVDVFNGVLVDLEKVLDRVKDDDADFLNGFIRTKIKDYKRLSDPNKNKYFLSVEMYRAIDPLAFFLQELYVKYYTRKSVCFRLRKIQSKLYDIYKDHKTAAYYNWINTPPRKLDTDDDESSD